MEYGLETRCLDFESVGMYDMLPPELGTVRLVVFVLRAEYGFARG